MSDIYVPYSLAFFRFRNYKLKIHKLQLNKRWMLNSVFLMERNLADVFYFTLTSIPAYISISLSRDYFDLFWMNTLRFLIRTKSMENHQLFFNDVRQSFGSRSNFNPPRWLIHGQIKYSAFLHFSFILFYKIYLIYSTFL